MTYTWITQLSKLSKAKDKEKLLEEAWKSGEKKLFEGLLMGLNPYVFYHFNKIALITEEDDVKDKIDWVSFKRITALISTRELMPHEIEKQVDTWVNTASVEMWNKFYRRILIKNWDKTITIICFNRVMKRLAKKDIQANKFICPVLNYHKAQNGKADQFIGGEFYVDPFISGKRQLLVALKSQNIFRVWDKKFIKSKLDGEVFLDPLPIDIVLDTVYDGSTWFVIDIAPANEFGTGFVNRTLEERHEALCELHELLLDSFEGKVKILAKKKISLNESNNLPTTLEDLAEQGFSYAVIKEALSLYQFGKNIHWTKIPLEA